VAPPLACPSRGVCVGLVPICAGAQGFTCGLPRTYEPNEVTCDSLDNDCDGLTDEGFEGLGELCDGADADVCVGGVRVCAADGRAVRCSDDDRAIAEVCDGADNDCDGLTDEGFDLLRDPATCGECGVSCLRPNTRSSCEQGVCVTAGCAPGAYDVNGLPLDGCEYVCGRAPSAEVCDGLDNDCDARVDEGLAAPPLACPSRGVCVGLVPVCAGAQGFTCNLPRTYELDEVTCDGLDNDCDGQADEGFAGLGALCDGEDADLCVGGVGVCAPGGRAVRCSDDPLASAEVCDGADNDCDGAADEGFDLTADPENCGACATSCARANAEVRCEGGACALTTCAEGAYDVNGLAIDGCEYLCGRAPSAEVCDGLDNDCDALVDEGVTAPPGLECGAAGVCVGVSPVCDGVNGVRCPFPSVYEVEEARCDRLDNDCDGVIDEGVPGAAQIGAPCEVGVGECLRRAVVTCAADGRGVTCGAVAGAPAAEACNGRDDDCDGAVDEQVARAAEMAQVTLAGGRQVWVDRWEASRPDATAAALGLITTHACSRPNVRPWANLTLAQARAACAARGKRLCVDAEWRAACGAQAYPYGAVYNQATCVSRVAGASPTASKAGCASPSGAVDMSGNVAEWAECTRAVDCQIVQPALGGSFADQVSDALRCDFRGNAVASSVSSAVGFRCCAD